MQCTISLQLLDVPSNVAILSRSPPDDSNGNLTLATYRLVLKAWPSGEWEAEAQSKGGEGKGGGSSSNLTLATYRSVWGASREGGGAEGGHIEGGKGEGLEGSRKRVIEEG